jgi:Tol biopolymer transport system component
MPLARRSAIALIVLAGCAAPDSGASEAPATDGPPASANASAPASGLASASAEPSTAAIVVEPTVLAEGVISTRAEEWRISFTPDGQTAYFARSDGFFPQTREATIMETTLVDGTWSEPVVASFSGEFPDIDPWVSPDGEHLYFSSIRPTDGATRGDAELFRVDRTEDGWSEPVHLAELGSELDELGLSVAADGTAVFASDRPGAVGGWDLYVATAEGDGFTTPEPLADLNTAVWEFNPAIDAEGTTIVFTSIGRPGGTGLGDLFVSEREGDGWSADRPLTLNTGADEYHASLSPDGETLYFVRRTGQGDLYEIDWAAAAGS